MILLINISLDHGSCVKLIISDQCVRCASSVKAQTTPKAKLKRDAIFVISKTNKFVPHEKLDKRTMTG